MQYRGVREDSCFQLKQRDFVFEGKMVRLSRDRIHLPHGYETVYETIHLPSAVAVVPVLDGGENGPEVVLVEQFRSSVEGYMHEIPAGIIEEGEDPAACARRELEEETGYRAQRLTHLATLFVIPGTSAHQMHFYLAEELVPGRQNLDVGECLRVRRFPVLDLLAGILNPGRGALLVVDTKTDLGILHAALLRGWSLGD